jgi:hypothetical protein
MMRKFLYLSLVGLAVVALPGRARADAISAGQVFAGVNFGNISQYSAAGAKLSTLNNGGAGGFTTGMAFDAAGNLYGTDFSNGSISKYGVSDGKFVAHVATGIAGSPESITRAGDGSWYVGGPGFSGYIVHFSADFSSATKLMVKPDTSGTGGTDWVDLAKNQTTLYYAGEGHNIKRFDTVSGQLADFNKVALPGVQAFALRILGDGSVLIADNQTAILLDSSGNQIKSYDPGKGVGGYFSLNLDPDGTSFWVGSFNNGFLYKVNIATGALEQTIDTGSGSQNLFGVAIAGEITAANPPGVPEPASLTLCGLGVAGLLGYRLRRKLRGAAAN